MYGYFWGYFKNHHFSDLTAVAIFGQVLETFGHPIISKSGHTAAPGPKYFFLISVTQRSVFDRLTTTTTTSSH